MEFSNVMTEKKKKIEENIVHNKFHNGSIKYIPRKFKK
jgi:hypothetical protein